MRLKIWVLGALFIANGLLAAATVEETFRGPVAPSARGIYLSFMGDPLSPVGIHFAQGIGQIVRLTVGTGFAAAGTGPRPFILNTGLRLRLPYRRFTPTVGASFSAVFVGPRGPGIAFANLGVEYTSRRGVHLGVGVNKPFLGTIPGHPVAALSPYLNVGAFF